MHRQRRTIRNSHGGLPLQRQEKFFAMLVIMTISSQFFPTSAHSQRADSLVEASPPSYINLNNAVTFEIAPHTGLMGKSGTFGLSLSMNYSSFNLELAGEQVIGRMANLYPLSVNAVLNLSTRSRLIPYGAVGIGLLLTVPTATIGDETVSSMAINFGAGARYYFTKSFGIRAEVKQYITSVKNNRDLKDELLLFQEISLGVTFMVR